MWWWTAALAGTLQEHVFCRYGPDQTYALYLPEGWTAERRWPVLVVLDPRGQAVPAMERFFAAADRDGFVVASSYDSRSDELYHDPTPDAVQAILLDLPTTAAIHPEMIVLAGFSGTARTAWEIGVAVPEIVAGVIGVGGTTGTGRPPSDDPPFPWVGVAGTTDFNWQEVRTTAQAVERAGGDAAFFPFTGPHSWPPADVADQAVRWIERAAFARGRWPVAPAEPAPPSLAAFGDQGRFAEWETEFRGRMWALLQDYSDPSHRPPGVARGRATLGIPDLERWSHRDDPRGQAAARALALVRGSFGFYLTREMLVGGDLVRARAALELVASMEGASANTWYDLACLRARTADPDEALEALAVARERGFTDWAWARQDPDLESLRADPRFDALVGG